MIARRLDSFFRLIENTVRPLNDRFIHWHDKKFKITEKKEAFYDSYEPNEIIGRDEYLKRIKFIKWHKYPTAFSSRKIPLDLEALLSEDLEAKVNAAENLESSICHQHVMLSPAALPVYDFLIMIFRMNDRNIISFSPGPAVKAPDDDDLGAIWPVWLLDQHAQSSGKPFSAWQRERLSISEPEYFSASLLSLFYGFSICVGDDYCVRYNRKRAKWENALRRNLLRDLPVFERYRFHPCGWLSNDAEGIFEELNKASGEARLLLGAGQDICL